MVFGFKSLTHSKVYPRKRLFLVGGEDVSLRIPMVKLLEGYDFDVKVLGSESKHVFDKANTSYYYYNLDRGFTPLKDIKTVFELFRIFSNEQPDVVHTFDTKPNILACIAAWLAGVPKIIRTINGMGKIFSVENGKMWFLKKIYQFLQACMSKVSQFTVFQNQDDLEYFISLGLISVDKAKYVPGSGVCIEDFEKSIDNQVTIQNLKAQLGIRSGCTVLLISRIIKAKGIIEYLESARLIKALSGDINFLLVGPLESGVEGIQQKIIDSYSDVCSYLGYRTDVSSLISLSDIVVLPSYYREGVPRALIEGAALCKPLIATDISGCRDIVIDQYNGLVVPIKNARKLSQAIFYLADNPEMRHEMGQKGRELVMEKFSLVKVCEGWRALY